MIINLYSIGIFIFYTHIMKTHIYKWPTDKIPLNAVPFYKNDTAKEIEKVMGFYKKGTLKAAERFDIETLTRASMDNIKEKEWRETALDIYDWDIANDIKDYIKNKIVFAVFSPNEWDWRLCLLCHEWGNGERLVVDRILRMWMWTYAESYRWFLKLLNEKFKEMWYEEVGYHFPVAHYLKPDLSREDYDVVFRLWATDDYMWTRCYVKYLNKKK